MTIGCVFYVESDDFETTVGQFLGKTTLLLKSRKNGQHEMDTFRCAGRACVNGWYLDICRNCVWHRWG